MSDLAIQVSVLGGGKIEDKFKSAVELANKINCVITFNMNGMDFVINKDMLVQNLIDEYYIRIK